MSSPNTSIVSQMEEEIEQESLVLKEIQNKLGEKMDLPVKVTPEEQKEIDSRSVFVGNVDFGSTIEELEAHFNGCGEIIRTTIPKDKFTKKQKNFAYIEFVDTDCIEMAMIMDGSLFRERKIVVTAKRTNLPGMGHGAHRGAGARARGGMRGRGRGGVIVKYVYINGPAPRGAARGGRTRFAPY